MSWVPPTSIGGPAVSRRTRHGGRGRRTPAGGPFSSSLLGSVLDAADRLRAPSGAHGTPWHGRLVPSAGVPRGCGRVESGRDRGRRGCRHQCRARRDPAQLLRPRRRSLLPLSRGGERAGALPLRRRAVGLPRRPGRARAPRPRRRADDRPRLGLGARRDARVAHAARALRHAPAQDAARTRALLRARRLPDLRRRVPGDPRARQGRRGSRVAPRLRAGRRLPADGRALPPARPRAHACRARRGARPLLPRTGGARHRRSPRRGRVRHCRRSGRAHGRVGRAAVDHVSRLHDLRDAAAHAGTRHAPHPESPRGLRPRLPARALGRAPASPDRDDQARLRRPRPLGGRPRAHGSAGGGLARQGLRGAPAPRHRPGQGAGASVGRSRRRHDGLRRRRRPRQRAERDPEHLQVLRLDGGAARHGRGAPQPRRLLQHRSRAPEQLRARASTRSTRCSPAW